MLTPEVVNIPRKALLLIPALALVLCSHLRPVCDFTVAGQRIDTGCTPAAARAAKEAALMAAEEILPGSAPLQEAKTHLRLSLSPGADSAPKLGQALLLATPGIVRGEAVRLDGKPLGTVADSADLRRELRDYIRSTLPSWASSGGVPGYLDFKRHYTRSEYIVSDEDMLLLITGLRPVMYTDGNGRISPV